MIEKWLPVSGYETEYEVSDLGNVRSIERRVPNTATSTRLLKAQPIAPFAHTGGYLCVKLAKRRKKTNLYIHRLVAAAFVGGGGREVLHGDGDKTNNRSVNLTWGSRDDNMTDRLRLGESAAGERHGMSKLKEAQVLAIRQDGRPHAEIASDYGVTNGLISMIQRRKIWRSLQG